MSLARFKASNHRQQTGQRGADDTIDDRATTPELFAECVDRWGMFTLDVAAAAHNAKCPRFYTLTDDGLMQPWRGHRVWCNPPYSDIEPWIAKAIAEHAASPADTTITLVLPANRTEQSWWQDLIEPHRDRGGGRADDDVFPARSTTVHQGRIEQRGTERAAAVRHRRRAHRGPDADHGARLADAAAIRALGG